MEAHAFEATVHISDTQLRPQLKHALELIQEARYKQAIRILDDLLKAPFSLMERLQILAHRALAHALWKKTEHAIDDATRILTSVQADIETLGSYEIDWEYERAEDVGHLAFLAEVYQLRGALWLLRQNPRRGVEDLSLSLFMTVDEAAKASNYLQRAIALIELQDCLERALEDLRLVAGIQPNLTQESFHLPQEGEFALGPKGISFRHPDGEIFLTPEKVRPRINRLSPSWFRLALRFGL